MRNRLGAVVLVGVAVVGTALLVIVRARGGSQLSQALERRAFRPVEGRFSGVLYVPWQAVRRTGNAPEQVGDAAYQSAIGALARNSADERERAIALFLDGRSTDGEQRLSVLLTRNPKSSELWNDLAVLLVARGRRDVEASCRALAAADRAIDLDRSNAAARFNRGIILEAMALRSPAEQAYSDYLLLDATSEWAGEARDRLMRLRRSPSKLSEWLDRVPAIKMAAALNDSAPIRIEVLKFPQEARTWTETFFLGEWGKCVISHDVGCAVQRLHVSRAIGETLRESHADNITADIVSAIDTAESRGDATLTTRLARGHVDYLEARRLYGQRDIGGALVLFARSREAFEGTSSPMLLLIDYYSANTDIDRGNRASAAAALRELDRRVPASYRSLRAQLDWLRGTAFGMDGLLFDALASYERARMEFTELDETSNATEMNNRAAAMFTILGRADEAWQRRGMSFAIASASGDPRRLETALYAAARDALREERWDVAHSLLEVVASISGGNPRIHAEATLWKALAAHEAHSDSTVEGDVASARSIINVLPDADQREDVRNELRLVEALLARDSAPALAVSLLNEHISVALKRGSTASLPKILVERAREHLLLGHVAESESDLRYAIRVIEERRGSITAPDLRDSFLGKSSGAYDALADLLGERGDTAGALVALDQRRARSVLERVDAPTAPLTEGSLQELVRILPPDRVILSYATSEKRLAIFAISNRGMQRFVVDLSVKDLDQAARQLVTAIQDERRDMRQRAASMFSRLIEPALPAMTSASNVVIVADSDLQQIPFAALIDENGEYLIDRFTISFAPSVSAIARRVSGQGGRRIGSVAVVGNPALDRARYPTLPELTGAESEARRIVRLYQNAELLVGNRATKQNVISAMSRADVVHFATHAIADDASTEPSRLLLAGGDASGDSLTAREIAALDTSHVNAVILASCRTAIAGKGYGDVRSLAAGFLVSGTRNVIASLWNIDDESVEALSEDLHRFLLRAGSAPDALRKAQLSALHSGRPELARPAVWASFQVYGYGE